MIKNTLRTYRPMGTALSTIGAIQLFNLEWRAIPLQNDKTVLGFVAMTQQAIINDSAIPQDDLRRYAHRMDNHFKRIGPIRLRRARLLGKLLYLWDYNDLVYKTKKIADVDALARHGFLTDAEVNKARRVLQTDQVVDEVPTREREPKTDSAMEKPAPPMPTAEWVDLPERNFETNGRFKLVKGLVIEMSNEPTSLNVPTQATAILRRNSAGQWVEDSSSSTSL